MAIFHSDELYMLEMYKSNAANGKGYCDLLVTDKVNSIFAINIIGTDADVKRAATYIQEAKTGQVHRAEGNPRENGHIRLRLTTINQRKKYYDEMDLKIDDMTNILMVAKNAKPDIKARNEWQADEIRRLESGDLPRELPQELCELILAWDGDYKEQVYKVLDDRYNTPMLPEWKDYIIESLISKNYYEPLNVYTFGTPHLLEAGLLRITEEQLESIISEGVQSYELDFAVEEDGRTEDEAVLPGCNSIDDYLTHFASDLGNCIQENINIEFQPGENLHHPAFRDLNLNANENGLTGYYPPQANTMMGVAKVLSRESFCFLIGEMGVGKSPMGAGLPYLTEAVIQGVENSPTPQRVILMSPGIMIEKWGREIKERVPNAEVHFIYHWTDVKKIQEKTQYIDTKGKVKYKKPEKWEYYIMSSELPKFTYPIEPIKDWRTSKSDITFYSQHEVEEDQLRTVNRMVKRELIKKYEDEQGNTLDWHRYEMVPHVVVKPENKVRIQEFERVTASARYEQYYRAGETGFYCPKCGGPLMKKGGKDISGPTFFENYDRKTDSWKKNKTMENYVCKNEIATAKLPKEDIKEWKMDKITGRYVPAEPLQRCGFVLWKPEQLPPESGYRKVSPTWYINKHLPRGFFKYLVADEAHEYKGGKTSVAQGFGHLVNHTEKQILLTGTLMGGMSRDIFYLLARLNPKGLLREGLTFKDEAIFNARYGISEYTTRVRNGQPKRTPSPKPGISPHLFPMHLMGNCAFLELNDMGYALPPYQEVPVVVNMGEQHFAGYRQLATDIGAAMYSQEGIGGMRTISTMINSLHQYSDAPFNIDEIVSYDELGNPHVLANPHNFEKSQYIPTKLQELINRLDDQIYNHGRKNLVYVKYTGKDSFNSMDTYLYDTLKARGYKVGILRTSGKYDGISMPKNSSKREEWLNTMMEKHDWDILITNPKLVKVGLDLLMFPNIHFFQLDYSTYDYMQASRRSWRIKQTQDVTVYTYIYRDTIQEKALKHIARKIDAAMAMQGKFSEEGLRAMADSDDGMNALAKQLMNDDVLEDIETVHDMFARKNQSFEEMQSVEFVDYEGYVMNPIEGGMETVRQIAAGLISRVEEDVKKGRATEEELRRTREAVTNYLDMFDAVIKQVDDVKSYNKGVSKKNKVIEGQQELDLFSF